MMQLFDLVLESCGGGGILEHDIDLKRLHVLTLGGPKMAAKTVPKGCTSLQERPKTSRKDYLKMAQELRRVGIVFGPIWRAEIDPRP